jgi:hypothetical protein
MQRQVLKPINIGTACSIQLFSRTKKNKNKKEKEEVEQNGENEKKSL